MIVCIENRVVEFKKIMKLHCISIKNQKRITKKSSGFKIIAV